MATREKSFVLRLPGLRRGCDGLCLGCVGVSDLAYVVVFCAATNAPAPSAGGATVTIQTNPPFGFWPLDNDKPKPSPGPTFKLYVLPVGVRSLGVCTRLQQKEGKI
jgi:hypothetical protein